MSSASAKNRLDSLTGLRAVAALAVFAQHFMRIMDCNVIGGPIGGVAVSFFFVLSGFILVYVYKDRLTKATTPKFYFTRFARIWPLHIACLLLIAGFCTRHLAPSELPWTRSLAHWSLLQAWYPAANWMNPYNGVAWSISVEAFFYLMFPLLLLGGSRGFWLKYLCLFPLTIGAVVWMANTIGPASPVKSIANGSLDPINVVQFFPPLRLLEFMTGMAAGLIFLARSAKTVTSPAGRNWKMTPTATCLEVLVLALCLGSFQLLASAGLFRYLHSFKGSGAALTYWFSFSGGMFFHAAVIYVFAQSKGWISRFSGSRVMVFLGEISFAFYMIHYPLIFFVKEEFWFASNFSFGYFALLTLTLSGGVAAWLYYLVEIPAKDTLLKWYSGDCGPRQLIGEMLAKPVQRLTQSSMIFALILALLVPVVVTKLFQRADRKSFTASRVLESVSSDFQPVQFGAQAELLGAGVVPRREAARVNTVWKFSSPASGYVTVHFAGTDFEGRNHGFVCGPDMVGQPFVVKMIVYEGHYVAADEIEVSITLDGQEADSSTAPMFNAAAVQRHSIFSREKTQEEPRVSRLPTLQQ